MDSVLKEELTTFFERKFEHSLEKHILEKTFSSYEQDVITYVEKINKISIS